MSGDEGVSTDQVKELVKEKSLLSGEMLELEKGKGILEAEIDKIVSLTLERIRNTGAGAAFQLQQQVDSIRGQLHSLFSDTLKVGKVVGEMSTIMKKGEESAKSLENFLKEAENRLKGN